MPKRKRSTEEAVADQLDKSRADIARSLKAAKGFERQRLAKRVADSAPDKVKRLQQEILVLKVSCVSPVSPSALGLAARACRS